MCSRDGRLAEVPAMTSDQDHVVSDDPVAEAERLLSGITRGPWTAHGNLGNQWLAHDNEPSVFVASLERTDWEQARADAAFIAAAPTLVARLVAAVKERDAEAQRLREAARYAEEQLVAEHPEFDKWETTRRIREVEAELAAAREMIKERDETHDSMVALLAQERAAHAEIRAAFAQLVNDAQLDQWQYINGAGVVTRAPSDDWFARARAFLATDSPRAQEEGS